MAFRYHVRPNSPDSHQASNWWFAIIVRMKHVKSFDRDKIVLGGESSQEMNISSRAAMLNPVEERQALLLTDQLVSWTVGTNKASHVGGASFKVVPGVVDYMRAVTAGDWILFWAFDNEADYERVLQDAAAIVRGGEGSEEAARRGVNGFLDGLKFVGRINAPKRASSVEPSTGRLETSYSFSAVAFSEFDAAIYYNQAHQAKYAELLGVGGYLARQLEVAGTDKHTDYVKNGVPMTTAEHATLWLETFMGSGPGVSSKGFDRTTLEDTSSILDSVEDGGLIMSPNDVFRVPRTVGRLLGVQGSPGGLRYFDLLNIFIGVQAPSPSYEADRERAGEQPEGYVGVDGFVLDSVGDPSGTFRTQWTPFDNTTTWNLLSHYSNQPLNEMFVSLRADALGRVKPTFVLRQTPMSSRRLSEALKDELPTTAFLDLPRWVVDKALVQAEHVGPSDSLRFNYVSVMGMDPIGETKLQAQTLQQVLAPPMADIADIQRNGVRSRVISLNSDVTGIIEKDRGHVGRMYTQFMSDILMDQHLRWNGTLTTIGIQEPIPPGDNLEWDGVVYHIESVTHTGSIDGAGKKSFRTTLTLSNGISLDSDKQLDNVYPFEGSDTHYLPVNYETRSSVVAEGLLETDTDFSRPSTFEHPRSQDGSLMFDIDDSERFP